jgi:uncharacterized membrane protein
MAAYSARVLCRARVYRHWGGMVAFWADEYPFGLLGIILSVEAIFITGFLLISSNRQSAHANKRAELDYEVNVRTYRLINKADSVLSTVIERLEKLEAVLVTETREKNKL